MKKKFKVKLSVWQFLALGYLAVIILGSVFLVLPFAAKDGQSTSYIDALFTAASAACITGLAPLDTGLHWSLFGQIVILLLIQASGFGFTTFASTVFLLLKKNVGQYERRAFMVEKSGGKFVGISKIIKRIFIGTAIFELAGAFILAFRFVPDFGWADGIYFSIWHSVSAFCNAGFDLTSIYGGHSLSAYAGDPLVSLTICALIIIGGLGFCVWGDIADCKFNVKKFQLNTKVILTVTSILLVVSTALYLIFEWNNPFYENFNFGEKLLAAIFNATTPRTAGFYSTPPETLSESSFVLTLMLMFIGGSSGSTAGGIKIGTFAVIVMGMFAAFRGRRDINIGKKRIDHSLVSQSLAILGACLFLIILSALTICALDDVTAENALFESVSALMNTGLSIPTDDGIATTAVLGIGSKIVLIILMYAGRVGILTLALALGAKRSTADIRKPVDTLMIG